MGSTLCNPDSKFYIKSHITVNNLPILGNVPHVYYMCNLDSKFCIKSHITVTNLPTLGNVPHAYYMCTTCVVFRCTTHVAHIHLHYTCRTHVIM